MKWNSSLAIFVFIIFVVSLCLGKSIHTITKFVLARTHNKSTKRTSQLQMYALLLFPLLLLVCLCVFVHRSTAFIYTFLFVIAMHDDITLSHMRPSSCLHNHGQVQIQQQSWNLWWKQLFLCNVYVTCKSNVLPLIKARWIFIECSILFRLPGQVVSLPFGYLSFFLRWSHVQCTLFTSWHYLCRRKIANHTTHIHGTPLQRALTIWISLH